MIIMNCLRSRETAVRQCVSDTCPLTRPRVQPVDATQALNLCAGASKFKVLRSYSFSCRTTLLRCVCEYTDRAAATGERGISAAGQH